MPFRKYLVTGGAGFVGSQLVRELVSRKAEVTVIDDFSFGSNKIPGTDYIRGDILHIAQNPTMRKAVERSDFVFHLAARVGVKRCFEEPLAAYETNVVGSHEVTLLCKRLQKPMLFVSSSSVYGKANSIAREDGDIVYGDLGNPSWFYSIYKAIGEGLARVGGFTAVRLFNVAGPGQRADLGFVIPRFIGMALSGVPITIYGDGMQTRSFCDIRDTVAGLILLSLKGQGGEVYNLGSPQEFAIKDLAQKIYEVLGVPRNRRKLKFVSRDAAIGKGYEECPRRAVDIRKIKALGFVPRYTLDDTIRWIAREDFGWGNHE